MDSKLDSNKDEKSNVTENDASKVETSRIKLFVGVNARTIATMPSATNAHPPNRISHYYSDCFFTC